MTEKRTPPVQNEVGGNSPEEDISARERKKGVHGECPR